MPHPLKNAQPGRATPPLSIHRFHLPAAGTARRMLSVERGSKRRKASPNEVLSAMALLRVLRGAIGFPKGIVPWFCLFGVVLVGWCVLQRDSIVEYLNTLERRNRERREVAETQAEIQSLETEREQLRRGGVRQEIEQRERYMLTKDDEKIVIVEADATASAPSSATARTRTRAEKTQENP